MSQKASGLVSVITPAFNAAAHLSETVESCLNQSYADFELLVVDDGSTDDTAAITHRYGKHDDRIRLFRIPNGGSSVARNMALNNARGGFLALLDSDDLWMPDYLERQITTLANHPSADVVTANAINLGGHLDGKPYWPASEDVRPISMLEMIRRENAIHIFSVFRRSVVDRIGRFDEAFRGNEDYDFWLRAAAAGCQFVADFTPGGYYRRRADSLSADERQMIKGIMSVLRSIQPSCHPDGPEARAIDSQLRRFQRQLLVLEARICIANGDSIGAVRFLERIPDSDRGGTLSALLAVAQIWPSLLSYSYQAKRAVREVRANLAHRHVRPNQT